MANTKTTITVCGKEYTIVSEDTKEHLHRVAAYVDEVMDTYETKYVGLNANLRTTLAVLNIADELLKARDELDMIRAEVEEMRKTMRDIEIRRQEEQDKMEEQRRVYAPARITNVR